MVSGVGRQARFGSVYGIYPGHSKASRPPTVRPVIWRLRCALLHTASDSRGSKPGSPGQSKHRQTQASVDHLPLSPLADASFINARLRWRSPKPATSSHKKTKLRRRLDGNPFAHILATPTRWCPVTKVHLPQALLQGFKLMAHPVTGGAWWVPFDLVPPQRCQPGAASVSEDSAPSLCNTGNGAGNNRLGPTAYTLAQKQLINDFSNTSGKHRRGYAAFFRMSTSPSLTSALKDAVWRSDMDAYILQVMRRRVCEDLSYLARLCEGEGRQYLVPFKSPDQLFSLDQLGCMLLVDDETDMAERPRSDGQDVDVSRQRLWLCSLQRMLGEDCVKRLRKQSAIFDNNFAVLVRGRRTMLLQEHLWKLQGYLNMQGE